MNRYPGLTWQLVTTFGLGHVKPASGTWGSVPSVLLAGALIACGAGPGTMPWVYFGVISLVLVIFSAACVMRGDEAQARWGKDPSQVVADETAGQCLPLMLISVHANSSAQVAIFLLALSFFAFRFFDIAKIEPADSLQRLPAGWGVLLDDYAAGLYAAVVVWIAGLVIGAG
jgi:phosphatidylglycerophosphatase A